MKALCLLEQTECELRQLVRLSQHRGTRLRQDLIAAERGGFFGHVDVANARVCSGQVQTHGLNRGNRDLQAVHGGAVFGAVGRHRGERAVDAPERREGVARRRARDLSYPKYPGCFKQNLEFGFEVKN